MKNRGCVADAFLERFGAALGRQKSDRIYTVPRTFLGTIFVKKSLKIEPRESEGAQVDPKV